WRSLGTEPLLNPECCPPLRVCLLKTRKVVIQIIPVAWLPNPQDERLTGKSPSPSEDVVANLVALETPHRPRGEIMVLVDPNRIDSPRIRIAAIIKKNVVRDEIVTHLPAILFGQHKAPRAVSIDDVMVDLVTNRILGNRGRVRVGCQLETRPGVVGHDVIPNRVLDRKSVV